MPRVSRSRVIQAAPERIWELVADPHSMARWWPKAVRVEDVRGPAGERAQWTAVLATERGATVRADYRCVAATAPSRYAWEQQLEGTPFERVLRASRTEIELAPTEDGTAVTLTSDETLRGISKLGGGMIRGAARQRLDEAMDAIETAVVG